ncbi:sulfurtransferase [Amphritea japonica]|uniref:Sulfurtransferase n=1 Tax=Amphritea japonica ATCC BAA-1530 TaxID=1278309 RepID=A0A7R6SRU6_9GAMM|nr:sulfurtransferase [Amphritea japonica]BBB25546.1 thiosulfate/3-mercaptopyruvate sulfurtransferase [Amphritea japonica ATCC BAA-1530]
MFSTLISVSELNNLLQADRVSTVVFDCRAYLTMPGKGEQVYHEGHIPGAGYLHLDDDLSAPVSADSGRHPLPDFTQLATKIRTFGVNPDTQVVVYDDCGGAMAARAWWLLRVLGHPRVAVLDGGYPAWVTAGGHISDQLPAMCAGTFIENPDLSMLLPIEQVASLASEGVLVDARTPERYRGEQEPIDPIAGHIPDAVNRPLQLNLTADGYFKSAEILHQEWTRFLEPCRAEQVAHYCGSGVTACHNLLAMEYAGLSGAKVYPGSWSEWIRDPARPVAIGD